MPNKTITYNQYHSGLYFSPMFIHRNVNRDYRVSVDASGLEPNDLALALPVGGCYHYEFLVADDFFTFESLLQLLTLEGCGSYIGDNIKRDTENYLAYCKNDCFFESLKWVYNPSANNIILAMDDRVKNNIVILKGLFLG